ncbi:MAG: TIM barrel protein [Chloroflexi bacterium]|nr:MAG: TIM barrel protein [Chloroflexota bacterium]
MQIANAPCSWGVLRGFGDEFGFPKYELVLDEMVESGYEGTELGDWGFMPTDAEVLRPQLERRGLALVGALVPWPLADTSRHREGVEAALRTARLLAACAGGNESGGGQFVILADDNGTDAVRTKLAGRIRPEHGLSAERRRDFASGAELVARAVRDETGLRTVFHHHCAGFVETLEETERLLGATAPELLGLCFDTGHWAFAGGDAVDAVKRFDERMWHVHFKDLHEDIAERARREGWDYFTAVRNGVFYGLGEGDIGFASVLGELRKQNYSGWIVVEDELPPGLGEPLESARRDRAYVRALEV